MAINLNAKSIKGGLFVLSAFLMLFLLTFGFTFLISSSHTKIHLLFGILSLFAGSFTFIFVLYFAIYLFKYILINAINAIREIRELSSLALPNFSYEFKSWIRTATIPTVLASVIALIDKVQENFNLLIVYVWVISMVILLISILIKKTRK